MAEADIMYRKYITQIECCLKNDYNIFKTLDKIGLVNTDEEDGEKYDHPTSEQKKQTTYTSPKTRVSPRNT